MICWEANSVKDFTLKKSIVLVLIAFLLVVNIIPSLSGIPTTEQIKFEDNIVYKGSSDRATTLFVGGGGAGNYSSIQAAIDDSSVGDTIFIYDDSSPYFENIFVYKTINIIGENMDTTVINGNNVGDVITITKDSVKINYVTVTNSGSGPEDAGIEVVGVQHPRIKNVKCLSNSIGIFLNGADGGYIEYNTFSSNSLYGGYLLDSAYNIFDYNECNDNDIGILLDSSDNNLIRYNECDNNNIAGIEGINDCDGFTLNWNVCKNNNYGIHFSSCYYITLAYNECNDSDIGFFIEDGYELTIQNNNGYNNVNYGFYFYNVTDSVIENSDFQGNNYGLYVSSSDNIDILSNNFLNGNYGIYLDTSTDNDMNGNDFSGNSYGIYLDNSDFNSFEYNDCINSVQYGVYLISSTYNLIAFTNCTNSNNGIHAESSQNNNIFNSICTNGVNGVFVSNSDNCNVWDNICLNNGNGIYIEYSENVDLHNNICSDNTNGIFVIDAAFYDVDNNICNNNVEQGIFFSSSNNIIIDNCNCMNNNININVDGGFNNSFSMNTCSNGSYGIIFSCQNTLLYLNNCLNNNIGIYTTSSDDLTVLENNCSGNNYGIMFSDTSGNEIGNNSFFNNNIDGLNLLNFDDSVINNNEFISNVGDGLVLTSSFNDNIYGNVFSDNGDIGASFDGLSNIDFYENNFINNSNKGIDMVSCDTIDIYNCSITDNGNNGISFNNCIDIDIYNNIISDNSAIGISFDSCNNHDIKDNTISDNSIGISISNSDGFEITKNWIRDNNNGVDFDSSTSILTYNNFFNNINNANDNGNNSWNITKIQSINIIGGAYTGGNYWSDYTGEDLNLDGLGDTETPYTSSGNIQVGGDYIPLVNIPPYIPSNPNPPDGATNTGTNIILTWSGGDQDPGDYVTYDIYFGKDFPPTTIVSANQTNSNWPTGQLDPSELYYWQIVATDSVGDSSVGPIWSFNTSENSPPNAPTISGKTRCEIGKTYSYVLISHDPDDNDVFYSVLWGDGIVEEWIGPVQSDYAITLNHSWQHQSTFLIMARVKDVNGAISPWATLEVKIPRSKWSLNPFIYQILERFFDIFPVFKNILRLIDIY